MSMSTPLSPRRRRLRWTLATLSVSLLVGGGITWDAWRRSQPAPYHPDERPDDITSELTRDLPQGAPHPRLTDVTEEAGLASFRNFTGARTSQLPEDMGPGLAWGDFDNDGDDDLFLVSAGGALDLPDEALEPCVLFGNRGDGTFERVQAFPELRVRGMAAAWGDSDADGFPDLVITGYNTLLLLHNDGGTGAFQIDPRLPNRPGFWSGAAWGDYDHDRRPDLYVCAYVQYAQSPEDRERLSDQVGKAVPYTLNPASYEAGVNALFRQNADGTFSDVAGELGVQNREGRSLGGLWHDWDDDGWLDLYVANDVSDNVFYRNLGGAFEEISHAAWVADYRSAMGLAAGDFDRDGDDDLFVSHWVAQENALYENLWADFAGAATNRLRFVDIADQKGLGQIALRRVGWGSVFADLDQDGWLDLICANGSTLEHGGPMPRRLQAEPSFLFWNQGGRSFHDLAPLLPGWTTPHVSRGAACADYDGDGDQDVAIADLYEGVRLYRNDMARGHALQLRLHTLNASGRPTGRGEGVTAIAWLGGTPLRRSVTGVSYLSQNSSALHWGLGGAARVERLEVHWPSGATGAVENLEANAVWEWVEGEPRPRRAQPKSQSALDRPIPSFVEHGAVASLDDRARTLKFWQLQRAAMDAVKIENAPAKALPLFRQALELNPEHEDAHYYLAHCLTATGDTTGALTELANLQRINPQSHRAWQQWGTLRGLTATNALQLAAAESALERAHALNPEETGALLVLGEIALLRSDAAVAENRLAAVCQANPKAAPAYYLRGFLAWTREDRVQAKALLAEARRALGPEAQPEGTTAEGDVRGGKQHRETTVLSGLWQAWNGSEDPERAFADLAAFVASHAAVSGSD